MTSSGTSDERDRAGDAGVFHRPADHPAYASPNTIASYCDTFRLLLRFAASRTASRPASWTSPARRAADRRVPRAPGKHPRQQRAHPQQPARRDPLAVRATSPAPPEHAGSIRGCSPSRTSGHDRNLVTYLTERRGRRPARACDQTTWTGRRDHAMIALAIQAGLRISELAGAHRAPTSPSAPARTSRRRKGRKERRHPARSPLPGSSPRLARRTRRAPGRSAVPDPARHPPQPRRHRTPAHQSRWLLPPTAVHRSQPSASHPRAQTLRGRHGYVAGGLVPW